MAGGMPRLQLLLREPQQVALRLQGMHKLVLGGRRAHQAWLPPSRPVYHQQGGLGRHCAVVRVLEAAALFKLEHVQGDYARVCHNGLWVGRVLQWEQRGQRGTSECHVSDTRLPGCWLVQGPCTITA